MAPAAMGMAIVKPIPLKAPTMPKTVGEGGLSFIVIPSVLLYYTCRIIAHSGFLLQHIVTLRTGLSHGGFFPIARVEFLAAFPRRATRRMSVMSHSRGRCHIANYRA